MVKNSAFSVKRIYKLFNIFWRLGTFLLLKNFCPSFVIVKDMARSLFLLNV